MKPRLPLGHLEFTLEPNASGTFRTPLFNAEVRTRSCTPCKSYAWPSGQSICSRQNCTGYEGGSSLSLSGIKPWVQPSGWLFYWFDLNVQLQYWPL